MAPNNRINREDQRVQRTYRVLKEAFERLLFKKSFAQMTVQEICDEAEIRRTTFYQHFQDKNHFLKWFIREKQQEFRDDEAAAIPPEQFGEHYARLAGSVLKYINSNEALSRLLLGSGLRDSQSMELLFRGFVQDITERLEMVPDLKDKLDGVPLPLLAEFYVSGTLAAFRWWHENNKPCSEEELIHHLRWMLERKADFNER